MHYIIAVLLILEALICLLMVNGAKHAIGKPRKAVTDEDFRKMGTVVGILAAVNALGAFYLLLPTTGA